MYHAGQLGGAGRRGAARFEDDDVDVGVVAVELAAGVFRLRELLLCDWLVGVVAAPPELAGPSGRET